MAEAGDLEVEFSQVPYRLIDIRRRPIEPATVDVAAFVQSRIADEEDPPGAFEAIADMTRGMTGRTVRQPDPQAGVDLPRFWIWWSTATGSEAGIRPNSGLRICRGVRSRNGGVGAFSAPCTAAASAAEQ